MVPASSGIIKINYCTDHHSKYASGNVALLICSWEFRFKIIFTDIITELLMWRYFFGSFSCLDQDHLGHSEDSNNATSARLWYPSRISRNIRDRHFLIKLRLFLHLLFKTKASKVDLLRVHHCQREHKSLFMLHWECIQELEYCGEKRVHTCRCIWSEQILLCFGLKL